MKAVLFVALLGFPFAGIAQQSSVRTLGNSEGRTLILNIRTSDSLAVDTPGSQALLAGGATLYTKEVVDNSENGTLFLRYRYEKNGEDVIFERTVKAKGKTDSEKQRIITETEQLCLETILK